jgi:hypothetical protein
MKDCKLLTNAEMKIRLKEMEYEYAAIQNRIQKDLSRLQELDKAYNVMQIELNKRLKGMI